MPTKQIIEHVIPQVGRQAVPLYSPADTIYLHLKKKKEIERLNQLRHLGSLSHALPGVRQSRWDYTVAILYYASRLHVPGMNSKFKIGPVELSSAHAALQCIGLFWNMGHVPGTFAVEKGIYRFLYYKNNSDPAAILDWPHATQPQVQLIQKKATSLLYEEDYLAVARILAVIKFLLFSSGPGDFFFDFVCSFAAPFLLEYQEDHSSQWTKLRKAFKVIRHLAYLTLDVPFSGLQWGPSIPALVEHQINSNKYGLDELAANISEILSPVEKIVYDTVYHSEGARKEAAVVAEHVFKHLDNQPNPSTVINEWLKCGLFQDLRLGRKPSYKSVKHIASIRLRSHFSTLPDPPVTLEDSLKRKKFSYPIVLNYRAWNSDTMIEPDELIIDAIINRTPTSDDVGRLIIWFIAHFENFEARPDDTFYVLRKAELEITYLSLLRRAVELAYPGLKVRLEPWRLGYFGLFDKSTQVDSRGGIWASTAKLDDPIIKHILRNRSNTIPPELRDQYAELVGIRNLRIWLQKRWKKKELRQQWLVITGSVRLCSDTKDLIEYDGGLIKVSSRSGRITWYGLESKRGGRDPAHSLKKRLQALGIKANIHSLGSRYAFVELPLRVVN